MKKIAIILSGVLFLFLISCKGKNEGGLSTTAQKNVDAMHGVSNAIIAGEWDKLDNFIAADAISHTGPTGELKGLANIRADLQQQMAGMSNMKTRFIKDFADDEWVMTWMESTGTLKVDQMGMKAGETFTGTAIEVAKFKDGKAIEHWTFMNMAEMTKMMGGGQPISDTQPMDTTKQK